MKIFSRVLSLLIISSLGLFYAGCGGGSSSPDPAEKVQFAKLVNTWKISSVKLDGTTRTDFKDLTLTVGGTFTSASPKGPYDYTWNGKRPNPSPWPEKGTWKFGSDAKTELLRNDDDLSMTYQVTDTGLTITFNYTGAGFAGGRANQVVGNWEFIFIK